MPDDLIAALEDARRKAREQWHADLKAARNRFDATIALAEAEYEASREEVDRREQLQQDV